MLANVLATLISAVSISILATFVATLLSAVFVTLIATFVAPRAWRRVRVRV